MSLPTISQLSAEILTTAAIDIGAKDAATKTARAQVALAVAGIIKTAGTGDIATALDQLSSLILTPNTDPGLVVVLQNLLGVGKTLLSAQINLDNVIPLLGDTVEGVLSNTATGMTAVASKYVTAAK